MDDILEIFTDGGARGNPGPSASAFVVLMNGNVVARGYKYLGTGTNNQAEYSGVINALEWLNESDVLKQINTIIFYLDSELVTKQLNKIYKVKNPTLFSSVENIRKLEKSINKIIIYKQIPRSKNVEADRLVNITLDSVLHKKRVVI